MRKRRRDRGGGGGERKKRWHLSPLALNTLNHLQGRSREPGIHYLYICTCVNERIYMVSVNDLKCKGSIHGW